MPLKLFNGGRGKPAACGSPVSKKQNQWNTSLFQNPKVKQKKEHNADTMAVSLC
jgi:hypothetical protein